MSELLKEARCYVADALDAHEHSDGRDLLNRIDAALRAEPGWQPISSAPRGDAGEAAELIMLGFAPDEEGYSPTSREGFWSRALNHWASSLDPTWASPPQPTHWMPLPTPPIAPASPAHAELSPGNSSDLRGEEG